MDEQRNWLDLPNDVTSNILHRLGVPEILESAQMVCTAWHKICQDPAMWRVIDMENLGDLSITCKLEKMCMYAIYLSKGQLVEINIERFPTNKLIEFLAQGERSSQLRRLRISYCYDSLNKHNWREFLPKAHLLEEIALTFTVISEKTVANISRYCPMLKSFTCNINGWKYGIGMEASDYFAIAIAKGMPQLLHLQLTGSEMTNKGLRAILDGCPNLQSLDLRGCFDINLDESCVKLCREQIKDLRLPGDSMEGHKVAPSDTSEDDDIDYNMYPDMAYDRLSSDDDYAVDLVEYYSL